MKKQYRLIKLNDNCSSVEIYMENTFFAKTPNFPVLVIVDGRTFSGKFRTTFDWKRFQIFGKETLEFGNDRAVDILYTNEAKSLKIRVTSISSTKIRWELNINTVSGSSEILSLVINTSAELLNGICTGIKRVWNLNPGTKIIRDGCL